MTPTVPLPGGDPLTPPSGYNGGQQPQPPVQQGPSAQYGIPEGFDHAAFQHAQKYTENTGTQISPDQFYQYAGYQPGQAVPQSLQSAYQQLYKHTAFYRPDGTATSAAPPSAILFPNYRSPGTYQEAGPAVRAQDYMSENVEASPLYNWQKQQGEESLARLASARGYTNSGREAQGVSDYISRISAEEVERQRAQANVDAKTENERRLFNTRYGNEHTFRAAQDFNNYSSAQSGLFANLALDSANRQERLSNTQYGRMTGLIDRMLLQSPFSAGVGANSSAGNAIQANASAAASLLGQLGSAAAGSIVPQYTGADNSGSQGFNIYGNYANSVNDGRFYSDSFNNIFNSAKGVF